MEGFLLKDTKVFYVPNESGVDELIKHFKDEQYTNKYKVTDYKSKYKVKKVKGEIVDEYWEVTITLDYAAE
jgi:hypothetical protein